ncbi:MAG: HEAT repeat domain-containing protein [Planctomycetes bacterium]|nr:HEAT repeat domain-containing protein [Planctomycetota bacterium]
MRGHFHRYLILLIGCLALVLIKWPGWSEGFCPSGGMGGSGPIAPVSGASAGVFGPGLMPRIQSLGGWDNTAAWEVWWTRNRDKYLNIRELPEWTEKAVGNATVTRYGIYDDLYNLLVKSLSDKSQSTAYLAALGLGKLGDARAIQPLITTYKTDNRILVRNNIILALGLLGDSASIETIKAQLPDKKTTEVSRSYAAIALGYINDPAVIALLKDIVANPSDYPSEVVCSAALSLGNLKEGSAIPLLGALLNPATTTEGKPKIERRVRAYAALGIGRIAASSDVVSTTVNALAELKKPLADKDDDIRASIAIALGMTGSADAIEPLTNLIEKDRSMLVRGFAAVSLAQVGSTTKDPKIYDILIKTFKNVKGTEPHGMVLLSLGLLGDERAKPELVKIFKDKKKYITTFKTVSVLSLGLLKDTESVPLLIEKMEKDENDQTLTPYIILALGLIKDERAVPPLAKILAKVDKNISGIAYTNLMVALTMLGKKEELVLPALTKHAAKDSNDALRQYALYTMGLLGTRQTAPAFIEAYGNEAIRDTAITGIGFFMERTPLPLLDKVTADTNYNMFMWIMEHLLPLPPW